jgi:hypothetical protein
VTVDRAVQDTINAQNQQDLALANTGTRMLGQVDAQMGTPLDTSGLPQVQGAPAQRGYQQDLDLNGLPQLYGADDLLGARQQVQDALYKQQASYLDPQYAQRDQALRSEVANKGITEGSEAWKNLMDNFGRQRATDYGQARTAAISGGGDEMARLSAIALANRGQVVGERSAAGDFHNQGVGAGNSDALRASGFNNDAARQALAQALAIRSQPLNELNALRSTGQVSVPQFAGPQTAQAAGTDTAGNTWRAYDARSQAAQLRANASNGLLNGLFGLGSAALSNPAWGG